MRRKQHALVVTTTATFKGGVHTGRAPAFLCYFLSTVDFGKQSDDIFGHYIAPPSFSTSHHEQLKNSTNLLHYTLSSCFSMQECVL